MAKKKTRTDAHRAADKRYDKKRIIYTMSYTPTDYADGLRLRAYLAQWGLSANAVLKAAVKSYLDGMDFPYPDLDSMEQLKSQLELRE